MAIQTHFLNLNQIYFFAFKSEIDQLNGIYKVQAILQSDEMEAFLEDPVQAIYAAVNKLDIYDSEKLANTYREEVFYKLQSVADDKVYYFPDSLIIDQPVTDFKKVMEYMVTLQIGAIDNPDELELLSMELCKITKRIIGIIPTTTIATYGETYLTSETIENYKRSREIYQSSDPNIKLAEDLVKANEKLRKIIGKYETIILNYEEQKNKLLNLVKLINPSS